MDDVDAEDQNSSKTQGQNDPEFGQRGTRLISKYDQYSLIISNKLPKVKQFKQWCTSEELLSIRANGMYTTVDFIEHSLLNPGRPDILTHFKEFPEQNTA